jgi:transcriptional regulator with PAS, ATPase and Fis domain
VDVRIIAACNQPLEPMVRDGRFRSDLYHRLNVVKLCLPPLRQRRADLPRLILTFAKRHADLYPEIKGVEDDLLNRLESEHFPGNVRELENLVQRMLFLKTKGMFLGLTDWTTQADLESNRESPDLFAVAAGALLQVICENGFSYAQAVQEIEKRVLQSAINMRGSTRRQVAERLHTSERTLYHKIRTYHLVSSATL